MIEIINPATEEVLSEWLPLSEAEIEDSLSRAQRGFEHFWRGLELEERLVRVERLGQLLKEREEDLARLISLEMGKVFKEAKAEIKKCQLLCAHYVDEAEAALRPLNVSTEAQKSYVSFEPLGVVLGIMPWNFPFWQALRFAVPTLISGNTVLLKSASNVMGCGEKIEELFEEAGFPEGVFQNIKILGRNTAGLIADPRVKALSLTGSTEVGRKVAALAGQHLKKAVLELGGSDPVVVLDDADLDWAAEQCLRSRLANAGQSCIAAKRLIVTQKNYADFVERLKEGLSPLKWGDPFAEETAYGPMARKDLRDELKEQVERSLHQGARCVIGGEVPDQKGFFYQASLLDEVGPGHAAFEEELFGPVLAVVPVRSEDEAIRLANQTSFGLGASVYSQDLDRAEHVARKQLEAGNCFVNDLVRSHPRLPFGGVKDSGWGRELSFFGPREFCNIKTVYIR